MVRNLYFFVLKKMLTMFLILIGLTVIVFFIAFSLPADPAMAFLGPGATPEALAAVRKQFGLDKPLPEQYLIYMNNLLHGNLGISIQTHNSVLEDITTRFPATVELAIAAILIAVTLGITIGVVSAVKRDTKLDHALRIFSISGVSLPSFFVALIFLYVFYFLLGWAPGGGRIDPGIGLKTVTGLYILDSLITLNWPALVSCLQHIILPAFSLALLSLSQIARMTRSSMLEALGQDYMKTAKAKGLKGSQVLISHALRNALLPAVTIIGLTFGSLLSGSVLVEYVYRWPGLGFYVTNSILTTDFPAIIGATMLISAVYISVNTAVDLLYTIIDPRVKVD
jgi:peptide/nickel transport system permease protein